MAVISASLMNGAVSLSIDTAKNQVTVTNNDSEHAAVFQAFNDSANPATPTFQYVQQPSSTSTIAIPTNDNLNGYSGPINWVVGQVTNAKTGVKSTTVISPSWQLTMQ